MRSMRLILYVLLLLFSGTLQVSACHCAVGDTITPFGCGCTSCDPGYHGFYCLGVCNCVNGLCRDGPQEIGACECDTGWYGIRCDAKGAYVELVTADISECATSFLSRNNVQCLLAPRPFELTLEGGHFEHTTSLEVKFIKFGPSLIVEPVPSCSITFSNSTHIVCSISVEEYHPSQGIHYYYTDIVVDGVTSLIVIDSLSTAPKLVLMAFRTDTATFTESHTFSSSLTHTLSGSLTDTFSLTQSLSLTDTLSTSLSYSLSLTDTMSLTHSESLTLTASLSLTETLSLSLSTSETLSESQSLSATVSLSATISISESDSNTLTNTITRTETLTVTESQSISRTPSDTITSSLTLSNTISRSLTETFSVSPSKSNSITRSVSQSKTLSKSVTSTHSRSPTMTESDSESQSVTPSGSNTRSDSFSLSLSLSPTSSISITKSLTVSGTKSMSSTPTFSVSLTITPSITRSITNSFSNSVSPSKSVTVSGSKSPSPTISKSSSLSVTPTESFSVSQSESLSESSSSSVSLSLSSSDTKSASITISISPTPSLSESLSLTASESQSVTLTPTRSLSESLTPLRTECPALYHHPPHCDCGPWNSDDCNCDSKNCTSCHDNYFGITCEERCLDTYCGGNGKCDDGPFGTGGCACDYHWYGSDCSIPGPVITNVTIANCFPTVAPETDVRNCRQQPVKRLFIEGRNFHFFDNTITVSGMPCRLLITRQHSTTETECEMEEVNSLQSSDHVVVLNSKVADSPPYVVRLNVPTLSETLSETITLSKTESVIPTCQQHWVGVQCTCEDSSQYSRCSPPPSQSALFSLLCNKTVGGTVSSSDGCQKIAKCLPAIEVPNCLCLDSSDASTCSSGNVNLADGRCYSGSCIERPVCNSSSEYIQGCTCTRAERLSRCSSNITVGNITTWSVCDGNDICVPEIEDLRIQVLAGDMGENLNVKVLVTLETGHHNAERVSLEVSLDAPSDGVFLGPMARNLGCQSASTISGTIIECNRGNLGMGHTETLDLYVLARVVKTENVDIVAEVKSTDITQKQNRHQDHATARLPVADLQLSVVPVEITTNSVIGTHPTMFHMMTLPTAYHFTIVNVGPTSARDVVIEILVQGGILIGALPSIPTTFEVFQSHSGSFNVFVNKNKPLLSLCVTIVVYSKTTRDHITGNNNDVLCTGPGINHGIESLWDPRGDVIKTVYVLGSEEYNLDGPSSPIGEWKFLLYIILFIISCLVLTEFRSPTLSRNQAIAHAVWSPQYQKRPKRELPTLHEIPQ